MNYVKKIVPALLIAIGLLAIGIGVKQGLKSFANRDRQVTVRGLAEREVKADKVTWPIVFKLVGNDLSELYNSINATSDKIIRFLTDNGVKREDISVGAPETYDQFANRYNDSNVRYRFNVTTVLVVTSSDVDKINDLIQRQSELLKEGIALWTEDYSYRTQYEFTGLNEIKPQMIAEATKNAREAAAKFAEDSDSKLGKIQSATQGQFSITDRDNYTPYIKNVRVVTTINYSLED